MSPRKRSSWCLEVEEVGIHLCVIPFAVLKIPKYANGSAEVDDDNDKVTVVSTRGEQEVVVSVGRATADRMVLVAITDDCATVCW